MAVIRTREDPGAVENVLLVLACQQARNCSGDHGRRGLKLRYRVSQIEPLRDAIPPVNRPGFVLPTQTEVEREPVAKLVIVHHISRIADGNGLLYGDAGCNGSVIDVAQQERGPFAARGVQVGAGVGVGS